MTPRTRSSPILATLLLTVPLLVGCLQGAPPALSSIGHPSVDERYVYRGDDGSRLEVRVEGADTRSDAYLEQRPVLLFRWLYRPPDGDRVNFTFWEAVQPKTGLIVQQVARCGKRVDDLPGWDQACMDERAAVVFAAEGLPGAFASGPFWGRGLDELPGRAIEIDNSRWPADRITFQSRGNPGSSCLTVAGPEPPSTLRTFAMTTVVGPVTLCDGMALPVSFRSRSGATFDLVTHEAGEEAPAVPEDGAREGRSPFRFRRWEAPLVVDDRTGPGDFFPVAEAHAEALERSSPYARLFEDGRPLVLSTFYLAGPTTGVMNVMVESRTERALTAVDSSGRTAYVEIEKTESIGTGSEYEIEEEDSGQLAGAVPDRSTLEAEQAELGSVLEVGRTLYDTEVAMHALQPWLFSAPWGLRLDRPDVRTDGYNVRIFFQDPTPIDDLVAAPYEFLVDGVAGSILWLEIDRAELPI